MLPILIPLLPLSLVQVPTLYDLPVSNHGARVRLLLYKRGLEAKVTIASPMDLGGLRSESYLELNPQGKMPLVSCQDRRPGPIVWSYRPPARPIRVSTARLIGVPVSMLRARSSSSRTGAPCGRPTRSADTSWRSTPTSPARASGQLASPHAPQQRSSAATTTHTWGRSKAACTSRRRHLAGSRPGPRRSRNWSTSWPWSSRWLTATAHTSPAPSSRSLTPPSFRPWCSSPRCFPSLTRRSSGGAHRTHLVMRRRRRSALGCSRGGRT